MTKKLRVAAIGTGYFSQFHYNAWKRCSDVEIVGIADKDLSSAEAIAQQFGVQAFSSVEELLDAAQPDLLDVITPPSTHLTMIEAAAKRGVNVVCQKPFCGGLEGARQAVSIGQDIDITVHENFRFMPWYKILKAELPRLGQIYRTTFRFRPGDGQGSDAYVERQPYFRDMPRFLVHETLIHFLDVFRYLLGEPQSVFADLQRLNPEITGEDSGLIILDFDGSRGVIDGNRLSDHKATNTRRTMGDMTIEGENGVLELDGDATITFRAHGTYDEEKIDYSWKDFGFGGDCVYNFTRHVVDHYLHGTSLENSAAAYIRNLEIQEAIYASSDAGKRISI